MRFGMPVSEAMQRHTYREYQMLMQWLEMEFDRPDRIDYYLMQIAAEVRRGNVKKPNSVKMEKFHLKFTHQRRRPKTQEEIDRITVASQARWMSAVGMTAVPKES
jgi:hypothetical protein